MENLRDEIWKDIEGYEGMYQVSNKGRVKGLDRIDAAGKKRKNRIIKGGVSKGYRYIQLSVNKEIKTFTVHRLVAKAFIPNVDNKPCVNHIDHNRLNNNISNLEWCTHSENNESALVFGKYDEQMKEVYQVDINSGDIIDRHESISSAANKTGIHLTNISACCRDKVYSAGGYIWVFNIKDIRNKLKKYTGNGVRRKVVKICKDTGKKLKVYNNMSEATRDINGQQSNIWKCCNGSAITHIGYKWEYAEQ